MPGLLFQILGDTDSVRHFDARLAWSYLDDADSVRLNILIHVIPGLFRQIVGDADSVRLTF